MSSSEVAPPCWTAQQARSSWLQCVSEIPFQTHIVDHSWPGGNDLCPLLMQLAVLREEKKRQKTMGSLPFLCLEYEVLGAGHLCCRCPAKPSTSAFWVLHRLWGSGDPRELPAGGWQAAHLAHPSAPRLFHP